LQIWPWSHADQETAGTILFPPCGLASGCTILASSGPKRLGIALTSSRGARRLQCSHHAPRDGLRARIADLALEQRGLEYAGTPLILQQGLAVARHDPIPGPMRV